MIKLKKICKVFNEISKIISGIMVSVFFIYGFMAFQNLQSLINVMTGDGKYTISELASGWKQIGDFMLGILVTSITFAIIFDTLPDLCITVKNFLKKKHKEITGNE